MKKVITILQLIIGFLVLIFALLVFYQSIISFIPALNVLKISTNLGVTGLPSWMDLVLSIFLIQVVAVYTKNVFDKLSVSG